MEIIINDAGNSRKEVKITIPADEVKKEYDDKINELKSKSHLKGFRPGKVPANVLEKKFGKNVLQELKPHFFNKAIEAAVNDHNLKPISSPHVDIEKITIEKDKPFIFEFLIETQPEFDLPEYKGLEVKKPGIRVSNKDMDTELGKLQREKAELVPVDNTETQEGDHLVCNVNLEVGNELIWGKENFKIEVCDTEVMGIIIGKKLLSGRKVGEVCQKKVSLPSDFKLTEYQGKNGEISFKIEDIKRLELPELDDAFACEAGFKDLPDMKTKIREQIKLAKEAKLNQNIEDEILKLLLQKTTINMPQEFVKDRVEKNKEEIRKQQEQDNKSPEQIEAHLKKQEPKIREQIEKHLREYLLIEKIAEQEKITVSDEDVEQEINVAASQYQKWPSEIKKEYEQRGLMEELKYQLKIRKVLAFIRENATVV